MKISATPSLRLAALVAATLTGSCTCSKDSQQDQPASSASHESAWAIHVLVGEDLTKAKRLDILPAEEISGAPAQSAAAATAKSLKPRATIETPSGTYEKDDPDLNGPNAFNSWALVWGAGVECGMHGTTAGGAPLVASPRTGNQAPQVPPWKGSTDWYIFEHAPASCDEVLEYEQTLLCIADKLAQVAEDIAPITWDGPRWVPDTKQFSNIPLGPWTLPPQAAKDRFIARDQAIDVLGHIARLDAMTVAGGVSCSRLYRESRNDTSFASSNATVLFGATSGPTYPAPTFLNPGFTADQLRAAIDGRFAFEAHVLRASGRMLHDLIRTSVYADLAGAEQRSAHALDPSKGSAIAWGDADADNGPYNSIAHATRILAGRWQLGPNTTSARDCGGVAPLNLIKPVDDPKPANRGAADPEVTARKLDLPLSTEAQAKAVSLVERAGLVVPKTALSATSSTTLRTMVVDQLVGSAALSAGVASSSLITQKAATEALVQSVSDSDLRFAFDRSLSTYRMMSNTAATVSPSTLRAGLSQSPFVSSTVTALGGIALDKGVGRERVAADTMARYSGLLAASQCNEYAGIVSSYWADGASSTYEPGAAALKGQRITFQDSFFMGQALHRRLAVLRSEAAVAGLTDSDVDTLARGALAELRSWSGPFRVLSNVVGTTGDPNYLSIYLQNIEPADLGLNSLDELQDELLLAWGPPWVAECAARLRTDCPSDIQDNYTLSPDSGSVWHLTDDPSGTFTMRATGSTGNIAGLSFSFSNGGGSFNPNYEGSRPVGTHLYLIARHDPSTKGARGMVLGAIPLRRPETAASGDPTPADESSTSFVVSAMQRELLHAVLGVGHWIGDRPPSVGESALSKSPDYCIDGVPRNLFVPLENELTSDGDQFESSWKHYLTLAKNAAARADDLGQQLVSLGLQKDFRREAAGEALAEVCGDYSVLDRVTFTPAGGVTPSPSDPTLSACLSEDKVDLVFLSEDPTPTASGSARTNFLSDLLKCTTTGASNPMCKRLSSLTTAGLGLAAATATASTSCEAMVQVADSLRTGFDSARFANVMLQPWTNQGSLASLANGLRLKVEPNGSWKLSFATVPIMSTTDAALWPACLSSPSSCAFSTNPMVRAFNTVFRSCAPSQRETQALGGCDAAPEGTSAAAETTAILWRVEGALWTLSALSGGVPARMYEVPIPAADFNASYWTSTTYEAPTTGSIHPGVFQYDSASGGYLLSDAVGFPTDFESRRIVGVASPLAGSALASVSINLRVREMPDWVRSAYAAPSGYRLVRATNEPTACDPTSRDDLSKLVAGIGGMTCPDPYANSYPTKEPLKLSSDDVAAQIGNIKQAAWGQRFPRWGVEAARACDDLKKYNRDCIYEGCVDPFVGFTPTTVYHRGYDAVDLGSAALTWVNSNVPCAPCQGAQQLVQTLVFSCAATGGDALAELTPNPPLLRNEGDIGKLEGWIGTIGAAASSQLGRLYLESVPKRVVNDYLLKSVGTGSKKGAHGEKLLAIREAIDGLDSSWKSIGLQIASVKSAINSARLRIARAKLDASSKSLEFALANMRLQGAMAQSVLNAVSTAGSGNYAAMAAAPVGLALSIDQGLREMAAMDSLKMLADEASSNDIALVVNDLASATVPVWREVDKSLASVRAATGQILTLSDQLKRTEEKAVYEAAKGAGKDYVMLDGKVVPMPVNVVLRRQYDTTSIRYQRALKDAKYFSFLARRAIEQRIGTPLDAISVRVGTLDPPATWADDICRLSGVDYKRLRYTAGPDAGADVDLKLVTEFADSFVGDYVAKLESFVEFYNVDYPSHEGDDTAILSLKDDLMPLPTNCSSEAANLLYYSGRLDSVAPVSSAFVADEHRWQRHACTTGDGKCLVIMPASAMVAPIDGPPVAQPEVTWLRDQVASSGSSDAGVDGGADADSAVTGGPGTVFGGAANMVSQSVQLEPGSYVLSWWDQARTSTGEIQYSGGTAQDYRVAVFDGGWTSVATWTGKPYQPVSSGGDAGTDAEVGGTSIGSLWSERRALTLTVTKSGVYNVGFAPSLDGAPAASLAISSVQLERVTSESSTPTSYIATTGSRQIIKPMCATRSAAEFRTAFERACTPGGACYYDLAAPLIIDTQGLGLAGSRLAGKLAAGNFNFRHIEVSLNLVGTGVRECSSGSGPACYGTGYLEFSLQHDGRNALLIDWANNARYFDFGLGNIEHGKALAAERFITMPVSSADQALLSQPGILKPEFRGRPLEGSYRLRIWDDAALRWDRLEDVQVILKYRYWSRINKSK